jgi:hypothetical protein
MSKYQLGRPMQKDELDSIVLFLETLNGEFPQSVRDMNVSD